MKKIFYTALALLFSAGIAQAAGLWEKQGDYYFLTKNNRDNFSAKAAGANKFTTKYLNYEGVSFLVRGENDWNDYGRLNLEGDNLFSVPIQSGMKVDEVHFLAGGNFGNSYTHDSLLRLYGDNYYYAVLTIIFVYQDGLHLALSVPVFWDWFHLGPIDWSKNGARIKFIDNNPMRKGCSIYHMSFKNPKPKEALKEILITDSWLEDIPFSEIFAITLKSGDTMEAAPKKDQEFKIPAKDAAKEPADSRTEWAFSNGLDGWAAGCSENWSIEPSWNADSYAKKGVVVIPACNWGGDKTSWIEKKITLPAWNKIELKFLRHSAVYSDQDKAWSDGLLKVIVKTTAAQETVYEKLYSGEWSEESIDFSHYKGQTVIIRFEDHGAGAIRLSSSSSPTCDGEDALITDIRLIENK